MKSKAVFFVVGVLAALSVSVFSQDWFEASGVPAQRGLISSSAMRAEFAAIETDIADKLPVLTGNGDALIAVNSAGTALEALSFGLTVAQGGTGATTASGARTALGVAIGSDVQAYDADLTAIAALANTDSNVIVGNGSAWVAETGATARTSLGLAIGTNVQAWDTQLDDIAALAVTNSNFIVGDGANWVAESGATARTSLGLGSLATLSAIDDDNWDTTDLAIANGGTGASTATAARANLGIVSIIKSTQENLVTSTTYQDDDDFVGITISADTAYKIDLVMRIDSSSTSDFKWQWVASQAPQIFFGKVEEDGNSVGDSNDGNAFTDIADEVTQSMPGSGESVIVFNGLIHGNASSAGTLKIQWAQGTSSGTTSVVWGIMTITELGTV